MSINLSEFIPGYESWNYSESNKSLEELHTETLEASLELSQALEKGNKYLQMVERIENGMKYLQTHKNDKLFGELFDYDKAFTNSGVLAVGLEAIDSKEYKAGMEAIDNEVLDGIASQFMNGWRAFGRWIRGAGSDAKAIAAKLKNITPSEKNGKDLSGVLNEAISKGNSLRSTAFEVMSNFQDASNDEVGDLYDKIRGVEESAEDYGKAMREKLRAAPDKSLSAQDVAKMKDLAIKVAENIADIDKNMPGWWKTGFNQGKGPAFINWLLGQAVGGLNIVVSSLIPLVRHKYSIAATSFKVFNETVIVDLQILKKVLSTIK